MAFFLPLFAALPVHAGSWQFTITGKGSGTVNGADAGTWAAPDPQNGATSFSISRGGSVSPGQTSTLSASANVTFTVSVAWVPNGSLAADPMPSILRVTESSTTACGASGSAGTSPVTGTSSATLTGLKTGTTQYNMPGGFVNHQITFKGSTNVSVTTPANTYGSIGTNLGFTYNVSAASVSGTLSVDQDQQVATPAATAYFSATISNASGFTVDSVKISVDGTPTTATVNPNNPNNYFINWPQTGGNPSEHSVTATAQIHDSVGALSLDSTNPPNRPYQPSGMGRPADDIIAGFQLQSLTFNKSLPLRYSASASPAPTPDPALVPAPQLALSQTGTVMATLPQMAYVQGATIPFTVQLYPLTGNATVGYTLHLTAKPLETNEAGLVLYDTGTTPQSFSNPLSLTSKAALYSEVNEYATVLDDLRFWVQFTKSTGNWASVTAIASASTPISNTVYATVATPSAPMAQPWVGVLNYACQYAAGTTDATAATVALTNGLYNHGHYNGGYRGYTDGGKDSSGNTIGIKNSYEAFHVQGFINAQLNGQCDDFADFLICMSRGIGALPLQAQRSASAAEILAGSSFVTKNITWSSVQSTTAAGTPVTWSYHQWTTSNVYDGCLRFNGTTSPINMMLPNYFSSLVATTAHANSLLDWDPQNAFDPDPQN